MQAARVLSALIPLVLALLLLGACDQKTTGEEKGDAAAPPPTQNAQAPAPPVDGEYPILREKRPYTDIHASAKQAWFLVETAYVVVRKKYGDVSKMLDSPDPKEREKGAQLRANLTPEIERSIFGVNADVEKLFQDAIKAEPDNPLNLVTYAYYLKARKRFVAGKAPLDTESEALEQMDKAIALWPDEANFYLVKAHIMTAPHQCFDWFRARALEELAIAKRLPQLRELLAKAEQYDPHNAYINYYAAQLITQYTDPAKFSEVRDDVLREIRAGNAKPRGYFFFPPPLRPLYGEAQAVQLFGSETEAKYVDMWYFFGHLDPKIYDQIVMQLLPALSWPADKQDIGELMYMLYNLGRVKPYDRSLFSLQLKILDYYLKQQEAGSPESVKLAAALRYLSEQYRSVANEMYRSKLITDPARLDVMGIQEQEMRGSRQNNLKRMIQGPQAAFLNQAGETLGISFPLPEDPNDW